MTRARRACVDVLRDDISRVVLMRRLWQPARDAAPWWWRWWQALRRYW